MKRVLSTILIVLILLTSLSGCYKDVNVLVIDEYPVYPGLYLYFQLQALSIVSQEFDNEFVGKELYSQTYEGVTVKEWINTKTIELAQKFVFIEKIFDRLELDYANVEYEMAYYESSLSGEWSSMNYFYIKNGIGFETFRKAYENYIKSNLVFDALYISEGGEQEVPEEEIKEEFERLYTYLDFIKVSILDEDGELFEEDEIKRILSAVKKMKRVAETAVIEEDVLFIYPENIGLQAAFVDYCEDNDIDEEDIPDLKGRMITEHAIIKPDSSLYEPEFLTTLFDARYNKFYIYEAEESIYLCVRRSMLDFYEDSWKDYKGTLVAGLRNDDFLDYLNENSKYLSVSEKSGARRYFNMKKASL